MATSSFFRVIDFTSTTADYDLLATDTGVRTAIKARFGGITDEQLDAKLVDGIPDMNFQVFVQGVTTIKINGEEYDFLEDEVFSTGDYVRGKIKTIQITQNSISGQFRFNIL